MDKRLFHTLFNELKDKNPDNLDLLEGIQQTFEKKVPALSEQERRALLTFPEQFIPRKHLKNGEWTSQLHIWAENGVRDIIRVNPMILTHKNSVGDTVLMSLISYALGKFTEFVDYHLIKSLLNTDFSYEEIVNNNGAQMLVVKNALDETDIEGNTIIDWLIDYAYGQGMYENHPTDAYLCEILQDFADNLDSMDIEESEPVILQQAPAPAPAPAPTPTSPEQAPAPTEQAPQTDVNQSF